MLNCFFIILTLLFFIYIKTKDNYGNIVKLDAAVIVEPRKHSLLIPIVLDTIKKLPKNTTFYIFHGTGNLDFIKEGLSDYIDSGKIILINMNVFNITVKEYSDILTTSEFWNNINGENILIFQTDSCICNYPTHDISYFLKFGFGYIGAPLDHEINQNKLSAQNGGFSLRKKSAMLAAIATKKENESTWPEDMWFSVVKKDITNPAPIEIASFFSVENVYKEGSFGIHKPWVVFKNELNSLKRDCPEISTIFGK